ncbi:MAG: hypothetical protein Q4B84_03650 [Clostridia bacterium]|nr:hypothetical protein [Clostridia bacterium]
MIKFVTDVNEFARLSQKYYLRSWAMSKIFKGEYEIFVADERRLILYVRLFN